MLRTLAVTLCLAASALAQSYYSATLDGAQEVPPVGGAGQGWAVVRFDPATATVRIFTYYENLSGPPTAAHLHLGPAGANGGVIIPLAPAGPGELVATAGLTAAQATALATSGTYLNVHTAANPGGEIRGQIVPSAATRFVANMTGAQEVPPTPSAATGNTIAFLHEPENRLVYMVNAGGLPPLTGAHFHQAPAGVNGPVVFNLGLPGPQFCGVTGRLTAAQVTALQADGFYVNLHTAAFPGGEIRGQLVRDQGDHFVAAPDGLQEVPPNPSAALAGVNLVRNPNGTMTLTGAFAGLAPTAAHVHLGPVGVNGPVVFALTVGAGTLSATFTPTAANLADVRAGNWYVNLHTAAFPGGEIRGQLGPAKLPTTFGQGCLGSNGVRPQHGARGFTSVGASCRLDLYGALPGGFSLFVFGGSRDLASGVIPLPISLPALGLPAPTCYLLVDPTTILLQGNDAFGCNSFTLAVPFNPLLRGLSFYSQWVSLDPVANPAGFVTSSALSFTLQ
jgi:hypothetical protein